MAAQEILIYWGSIMKCRVCIPVFNFGIPCQHILLCNKNRGWKTPAILSFSRPHMIVAYGMFQGNFSVAMTKFLSLETAYPNSELKHPCTSHLPVFLISLSDPYPLYCVCTALNEPVHVQFFRGGSGGRSLCCNSSEHPRTHHTISFTKTHVLRSVTLAH